MLVLESNSFAYVYAVTDDGGNTWAPVITWGTAGGVEIWYVANAAATSSVTISYEYGVASLATIQEFSGMGRAGVDKKTWTSSVSTSIRTSALTPWTYDLCLGAVGGQEQVQLPDMKAVPSFHNSPQFDYHDAPTDYVSLIVGMRTAGPISDMVYGADYRSSQ